MSPLMRTPLRPCNPMLHAAYTPLLDQGQRLMPAAVAATVQALVACRNGAPEDNLDAIDAEIVGRSYWYVLRPDAIARAIIGPRWRISVEDATLILAACGEAGYDISGNGAPHHDSEYLPTSGPARDALIWGAAEYWACAATQDTYVSLGDSRGFLGSMHPKQQAALTFGPEPSAYMRRHTRRLLVVRPDR